MTRPCIIAAALVAALVACDPKPPDPELTLADASEDVIFASVERLGPHRYVASATRTDTRQGRAMADRAETVDIGWESWDRFRYERVVNGSQTMSVIVSDGTPYARHASGSWERKEDAEPYRVQLQSTWSLWDEALEIFGDRVELTLDGEDIVEGRRATRYQVSLRPLPEGAKLRASAFEPTSLSGLVWLDEATAVRLTARVEGEARRGDLVRKVTLRLVRSDFGAPQDIAAPAEARTRDALPTRGP